MLCWKEIHWTTIKVRNKVSGGPFINLHYMAARARDLLTGVVVYLLDLPTVIAFGSLAVSLKPCAVLATIYLTSFVASYIMPSSFSVC